jgi:DNA-directed RNA polymerase specialized sigma subunit
MTVKQFLYSVRDEQKEIEELTDRIYEMRMSLLPAGIRYDTDKVQTSPEDKLSECEAKIADYSMLLGQKKEALIQRRHRAQEMIDLLEDSRERQVLDIYFLSVKRLSMEDVSAMIGYSRKQTFRIYKSALQNLIMTLNDTKKF